MLEIKISGFFSFLQVKFVRTSLALKCRFEEYFSQIIVGFLIVGWTKSLLLDFFFKSVTQCRITKSGKCLKKSSVVFGYLQDYPHGFFKQFYSSLTTGSYSFGSQIKGTQ